MAWQLALWLVQGGQEVGHFLMFWEQERKRPSTETKMVSTLHTCRPEAETQTGPQPF